MNRMLHHAPRMSRFFVALIWAAPAISVAHDAFATEYQFTWGHPRPQGNWLGGLAFENNAVGYAVGDRGVVLRTIDGGLSWTLTSHFPDNSVDLTDLVILAPGELLAVGASPGIFHSLDGGATWAAVSNPSSGRLQDIEFVTPTVLSAIGDGGQVLRSNDRGASWSLLASPGSDLAEQFWFDAMNGYVVGSDRVRRTTNGGASWSPLPGVPDGGGDRFNEVFFTDAMHGLVMSDFMLATTANGGASWSTELATLPYWANAVVLGPQEFLVATNFEGAFIGRTIDGGASWNTVLSTGGDGFLDFDRLPDGTLLVVGSEGDIYRSSDNGMTWTNRIEGREPFRAWIGAIGAWPGARAVAGTMGTPGEQWYRSDDGGSSWIPDLTGPMIGFTNDIAYWDESRAIAAGDYGKVWRTADGGITWTAATLPGAPVNGSAWHVSIPAPGVAFAAVTGMTESMVYRTTDYGASWQPRTTGIPTSGGLTGISFPSASVGFVSGYSSTGARMFKTTDGGGLWSPVAASGLPTGWTLDLQFSDAMNGLATKGGTASGIYRTTNGGLNWTQVVSGSSRVLSFSDATHGFASGDGAVLATEDGGTTWQTIELPAASAGGTVTALPDGFLAGGASGIIIRATRVVTSVENGNRHEGAMGGVSPHRALLTASPSVGSVIGIAFAVTESCMGKLDIVDALGRRVTTLRSGHFAPGVRVATTWDGSTESGGRAASGVYFARLTDGREATAVRVVLVR